MPENLGPFLVDEHNGILVEEGERPDDRPVEEILMHLVGEDWAYSRICSLCEMLNGWVGKRAFRKRRPVRFLDCIGDPVEAVLMNVDDDLGLLHGASESMWGETLVNVVPIRYARGLTEERMAERLELRLVDDLQEELRESWVGGLLWNMPSDVSLEFLED